MTLSPCHRSPGRTQETQILFKIHFGPELVSTVSIHGTPIAQLHKLPPATARDQERGIENNIEHLEELEGGG